MTPLATELPHLYLKPGEMRICEEPTIVTTLLGSCVAVAMYNERLKIGAICHGLLPSCRNARPCDGHCLEGFRYVDCSIRRMLEVFQKRGIVQSEIDVKVFGGSDMFNVKVGASKSSSVGRQNVEKALQIVDNEGLRIIASDLGGLRGRKIYFYTHTGEVLLKRLHSSMVIHSESILSV